ncbi:MAG: hypothetical protein C4576_11135 [Desulfobacteraceae bacterium]|nr:MAG: hypothetical protein C4576_11135 [Desulfobacteraceae bacterium]
MIDALKAAAPTDRLIVVGCALRPEDAFLSLLITHFLQQPNWSSRRVIVVDPRANEVCGRIRNYWGVNVSRQIVAIESTLEASAVTELLTIIKGEPRTQHVA